MITVFHACPYGRFIEIESNLRRKKLHRMNQGSNFLGGSFSNRDNVRPQSNLKEKVNHRFPSSTSSKCFDTIVQQGITTSFVSENQTAGISFIGEAFRYTEIPSEVNKIILESWQLSTGSRYESMLKTMAQVCNIKE